MTPPLLRRSSVRLGTLALCAITTATLLGQARPPAPASPSTPPRLIVLLVMDQFPASYITMYGKQWTSGLRRLLDGGAVFTEARYPYALTFTCAGHSTIGTGALPFVHGMMSNSFFDRAANRTFPCMYDPKATSVPFGGAKGQEHHSYRPMRAPTFAQMLREQAPGQPQVVSLALKPRSAIGMGGSAGPGATVVWEEDDGTWATSDAYTSVPWPDVDAFIRKNPLQQAYGATWRKYKPDSAYLFEDDAPGEAEPVPWKRTFPHGLDSPSGKPDVTFVTAWERSPWSDEYLARMAMSLLQTRQLGSTRRTDMLAVSLPALDLVAHEFGPNSHEAQDVLMRADVLIGRLLEQLDARVGQGNYVVAFSSDHGIATLPERLVAEGKDAGRVSTTEIRNAVNAAVAKLLGATGTVTYVVTVYEQQVVLTAGTMDKLRALPGALDAVKNAIKSAKGIAAAYTVDEIVSNRPSTDPFIGPWRLSLVRDRAGDLMFVPKPMWIVRGSTGTTHGTPYEYDQRVPLILYGARVKPGRYASAASPADIAPTFAWFTRVNLDRATGRVLTEALKR
jgi:predicted AlkP superfamily pyrophosphatase or phosphodiesterase